VRRALAVVVLALSACSSEDDLTGRLSVRTEEYGSWTMSPTTCISGEHQLFFGVDLTEDGDVASGMRIVLDPEMGYSVAMNVPGHDLSIKLEEPATDCEIFDVLVQRGNTRVNNIWEVEGHATLKCRLTGLEIDADLQFTDCT
jgi:hypothetical protein